MNPKAQQLEALLFTAGEAVARRELAQLLHVSEDELQTLGEEVRSGLVDHGICLVATETHLQIMTAPSVSAFLEQFLTQEGETLSKAASEVLALVAYRGPIARFDIEAIRGVDSTRTLRQLVWRGLVTKQKNKGRNILYDVSEEFFAHIGVSKREDLPQFDSLKDNESLRRLLSEPSV